MKSDSVRPIVQRMIFRFDFSAADLSVERLKSTFLSIYHKQLFSVQFDWRRARSNAVVLEVNRVISLVL